MADIAVIYGFGHAEMCAMDLAELTRWQARAQDHAERQSRS